MNKIRGIRKSTDVSTEALTASEFKTWAKIEGADDDTNITNLIKQVRENIERKTGLGIGSQTLQVIADLYGDPFELPRGPVTTLTSIEQKIDSTDWDTLTEDIDYDLEINDFVQVLDYGCGTFRFTYVSGYTSATIPAGLKLIWLKLVLANYEQRGDTGTGDIKKLENELNSYKRFGNLL